jgi:hypothetical protein
MVAAYSRVNRIWPDHASVCILIQNNNTSYKITTHLWKCNWVMPCRNYLRRVESFLYNKCGQQMYQSDVVSSWMRSGSIKVRSVGTVFLNKATHIFLLAWTMLCIIESLKICGDCLLHTSCRRAVSPPVVCHSAECDKWRITPGRPGWYRGWFWVNTENFMPVLGFNPLKTEGILRKFQKVI